MATEKEKQYIKDVDRVTEVLKDVLFDTALDAIVDWAMEDNRRDEIIGGLENERNRILNLSLKTGYGVFQRDEKIIALENLLDCSGNA